LVPGARFQGGRDGGEDGRTDATEDEVVISMKLRNIRAETSLHEGEEGRTQSDAWGWARPQRLPEEAPKGNRRRR